MRRAVSKRSGMTRREALQKTAAALTVLTCAPASALARRAERVSFGLCADVHQDVMHDAPERLARFVQSMEEQDAAFIAQLGDFCIPKDTNQEFLDVFHSFAGDHYHVLGNHDTDADNLTKNGYSQRETMAFWGMARNYHSFETAGIRFIVLDGNEHHAGEREGHYPLHVGQEQLAWLEQQLAETTEPVILFSHQSPENAEGLDNGWAVRAILEEANRAAGWRRVLAYFSGHHHLNDLVQINGIPYVQVNSMSYFWVGEECQNFAYPEHIHAKNPMLEFTAPYRDPIWSRVTVDPSAGEIRIEGRWSEWAGNSPEELGYEAPLARRRGMSPRIDDRRFPIASGD